jgi:hypothetical protein
VFPRGRSSSNRRYGTVKKRFPQYLTQPFMILSFEPDEQMITLTCVVAALTIWGFAILLPFTVPYLYITTKKKYPRGFVKHVFYVLGFVRFDGYPTFHEREFVE